MEEVLKELLLGREGIFAYATVFGILLICGLGVPLPEDIALLLGGYLAHAGAANVWVMVAVGYVGIAVGDSMIFAAGRRMGRRYGGAREGFWAKVLTEKKREKVRELYAKWGPQVVLVARFLPGLRAVAFFTAGSTGMRYLTFLFYDSVAALASAPIFVLLGYKFGGELDALVDRIKKGQLSAIATVAAVALIWFGWRMFKARRAKRAEAKAAASADQLPK